MRGRSSKRTKTTIAVSADVKAMLDKLKSLTLSRSYDDVIRLLINVYTSYEEKVVGDEVKNFVCSKFGDGSSINYQAYIRLVVNSVLDKYRNSPLVVRESAVVAEAIKYVKPLPERGMVTVDTSLCGER